MTHQRTREIGHFMIMSLDFRGAMYFIKLNPTLSFSHSLSNLSRSFLPPFSTVVSTQTQASAERISTFDYLNTNFKFSKAQSNYISKRLSQDRCPQHPLSVLNYFKEIRFSEAQINSLITSQAPILFYRVETLKPKVEYLQLQGFEGSELGELLSKNPSFLTCSLEKKMVPFLETLGKIASNKKDLMKALRRYWSWKIPYHHRILHNAAFFESCGIVGSQLSMLLAWQPRLFAAPESLIRNLVKRAVNLGFNLHSRMLVHAIGVICSLSIRKFKEKVEFIQCCGFSEEEVIKMFRGAPRLLQRSEKKLEFRIHVCLETIMLPKSLILNNPVILALSMEKRVLPRWRVLQLLISKKLLQKNPSFLHMLKLNEEKFLKDYILKFRDEKEALLEAYKFHCLKDASTY